jgi:hypothetical protein
MSTSKSSRQVQLSNNYDNIYYCHKNRHSFVVIDQNCLIKSVINIVIL